MFLPYGPIADGKELTASPLELVQQGKVHKVPLLIGHVGDEARLFVYDAFTSKLSKVEVDALLRVIFNGVDV